MSDIGSVGDKIDIDEVKELYNQYLQAAYGITEDQLEDLKRRMDAQEKLFAVYKIFGDGWTMAEHRLRKFWIDNKIEDAKPMPHIKHYPTKPRGRY